MVRGALGRTSLPAFPTLTKFVTLVASFTAFAVTTAAQVLGATTPNCVRVGNGGKSVDPSGVGTVVEAGEVFEVFPPVFPFPPTCFGTVGGFELTTTAIDRGVEPVSSARFGSAGGGRLALPAW